MKTIVKLLSHLLVTSIFFMPARTTMANLDIYVANSVAGPGVGLLELIFFNDGNANFADSGQTLGNGKSNSLSMAYVDGDIDALVGLEQNPIKVWLNDGSGNFSDSGQNLGTHGIKDVILVDFDVDGDVDAFTVVNSNCPNSLWLNNGSGIFSGAGLGLGNLSSVSLTTGDFDGDGDLDVYVVNTAFADKLWPGEQN